MPHSGQVVSPGASLARLGEGCELRSPSVDVRRARDWASRRAARSDAPPPLACCCCCCCCCACACCCACCCCACCCLPRCVADDASPAGRALAGPLDDSPPALLSLLWLLLELMRRCAALAGRAAGGALADRLPCRALAVRFPSEQAQRRGCKQVKRYSVVSLGGGDAGWCFRARRCLQRTGCPSHPVLVEHISAAAILGVHPRELVVSIREERV